MTGLRNFPARSNESDPCRIEDLSDSLGYDAMSQID
jgi:hypothetical protein